MEKKDTQNNSEMNNFSLQELQIIEQGLQNLGMQKQIFQMELVETSNALEELQKLKTKDEIFKIVGTLMIKSNKEEMEKELTRKKDLLNLRITSIEKQEESLKEKLIDAREDVLKKFKKH